MLVEPGLPHVYALSRGDRGRVIGMNSAALSRGKGRGAHRRAT